MLSQTPPKQLEALASDRQIWRDTCDSGLHSTFLAEYERAAENRRVRRYFSSIFGRVRLLDNLPTSQLAVRQVED